MIKQQFYWAARPSDVDMTEWAVRWPSFMPREVCCKGNQELFVEIEAMDKLQKFRELVGYPFVITSAYRSPKHNQKIGGSVSSQHIYGRAFDVSLRGIKKYKIEDLAKLARISGFNGVGLYDTFIHVDNRPTGPAEWDLRSK